MFQLGGVAGHLFRPLAEAVVFALIGSFILSRTLVPTMANYLMRGEHGGHGNPLPGVSARARNPLKRFQQAFDDRFGRIRARYRSLLLLALGSPKIFIVGFLVCVLLSFGLFPFLGQNFFPTWMPGRSCCTCARSPAPASRRLPGCSMSSSRPSAKSSRPRNSTTSSTISGCRFPASTWPTRTPERSDRRTATPSISLKEDHSPTEAFIQRVAHHLAAEVSRHHLLVPARRHRVADSQFRPAGADRRPGHRQQPEGQLRLCHRSAQAYPHRSRHR